MQKKTVIAPGARRCSLSKRAVLRVSLGGLLSACLLSACSPSAPPLESSAASLSSSHVSIHLLAPHSPAPHLLAPCPGFAETGKPALVDGAQCGELQVRENPQDPDSPLINLAILRLPAINPSAQQDPVFFIQGGPGGSSIAMAEQLHWQFAELRKYRDLLFVDQRGTGASNPLNCVPPHSAEQQLPEAEQLQAYLARMRACAEKYAAQAPFYTTPYAVADLDAVREALGYQRINLWGGSYGTRVVLEYMRTRPERLRAVVMDGLAPVQIALPRYSARDTQNALAAVNRECAQQPDCVNRYGDLQAQANKVFLRLQHSQARGEPLQVAYEHPRYQVRDTLWLTPRSFSSLVLMALYSRDLTVLLPRALADAAREDYRLLAALQVLANAQSENLAISEGVHFSVLCNEDARVATAVDPTEPTVFLGVDKRAELADICAHWPVSALDPAYFAPVRSDVPALLLSGGHDPVTPARWAEQVAQHLTRVWSLSAPGGNHIVSTEGCAPQLIAQFISQGHLDNANTQCMAAIKPLPLVLGADEKPLAEQPHEPGHIEHKGVQP